MEHKIVEPVAERKYHLFNILHEEEEDKNIRLSIPCENLRIQKEGTSRKARAVPRKVMSFTSPFPFFWTSMKPSYVSGCQYRMTIPIKFAREHLVAEVTNPDGVDVLLQNKEGLSWEVLVRRHGIQYAFCTGWKDFATDNRLKIGDFVIFELTDRLPDSTFAMSFHICRISVPVRSPVPAQESNEPQDECFTSFPLAQERKRCGREAENSMLRKGGSNNDEMLASARSVPSPYPFFGTTVKPHNIFGIFVPVKFAREHLPTNVKSGEIKMDVLLQNVEGRSWELRLSSHGGEKYYLGKGWKTFASDNKLNIGDRVLFELISRLPDATLLMNFHIHRIPVFVDDDLDDE